MSVKCGAKKRSGSGLCGRPAGWGTGHLGFGRCKLHGGASPNGETNGKRLAAESAVAMYGLPRAIDPHAALLEELHRTAGHVAWLAQKIADFETDGELKQYAAAGTFESDSDGVDRALVWEKPAVWVEMYHRERVHFAKVAKTCVSLGIEERRVHLAEQQGQLIAQVLRGVLTELGVIDRPEVPAVVRRHLTLVAPA